MLRVFCGEEDFLIYQAVNDFKKDFIAKNPQALVEIFDGGESPVEDFFRSLSQGGGLFFSKKLVILRNIFEYQASVQEKILDFFKNNFYSNSELPLIITWNGKPKISKLLNYLKKNSELKEFKKSTILETEKFILKKLEKLNKIEPKALQKLALVSSGNLWVLDRELEKLISYQDGKLITEKDVDALYHGGTETKIFDLVDAIGNRNKKRAHQLLTSLLEQGEDGFYILSMMIFQIRNLSLVSNCKERGIFQAQIIAQKTGLHPFVVQKALVQLGNFRSNQLKEIYQRTFLLDINSKSGKIDIKEALEDFIIKI